MDDKRLLAIDKDPMGQAIFDFYTEGRAGRLRVFSPAFEEDEIPVKHLFRELNEMSAIEQMALNEAKGRILDVGGGSGCHSLELQRMGKTVEAIDISPLSVEVMNRRGLTAYHCDLFDASFTGRFDTILLLMNGSGIIGRLSRIGLFFERMKQLMAPEGCVLMDSSDLKYLYEDEDGSYLIDLAGDYYGEMTYEMQYKQVKGSAFDWLYIDFETLRYYAGQYGFEAECLKEGKHYDYLAKLTLRR